MPESRLPRKRALPIVQRLQEQELVERHHAITEISAEPLILRIDLTEIPIPRAAVRKRTKYTEEDSGDDSDDLLPALALPENAIEAPPPGVLPSLWYSHEQHLNVWVVDKILAVKERPTLYGTSISEADARKWQALLLPSPEVSRLDPTKCPVVQTAAAAARGQALTPNATMELAVLVKWRGRSYLHVSWERVTDFKEPSFRPKLKRFYANQENLHGPEWQSVQLQEDYLPATSLMVERIVGCDESEMNMDVFVQQEKRNEEVEAKKAKAAEQDVVVETKTQSYRDLVKKINLADFEKEIPWDPEDNVRYICQWKGLPLSEMTWEYWRDIKSEAVDAARDFWHREWNVPSDLKEPKKRHVSQFRKLTGSPKYGIKRAEADEEIEGFHLRGYQLEGVNWLLFNWWNQRSCVLADEMGLGKTIQSAAFLQELQVQKDTNVRGPFLVVAPLSLVGQWQSELLSWAPDMNVVLYHGHADARDFLVQNEFYFLDQFLPKQDTAKLRKQHVTKFHVLITTYEVVLKDAAVFSAIKWKVLIVDEAHRLKNPKSRLFEQLANVPRDYCVLLTGTPIANATEELWSLLHFANPKVFADKDGFLRSFGKVSDAQQVKELHNLLKPYLLRRVKEDVEKSLPPKEETILEVSLTPIQKTFYKAIYERNTAFLFKGIKPSNAPSLMNVMMELRKCCNHPYLIKGAEERILADASAKLKEAGKTLETATEHRDLFAEQLVKSSGKMVLMEKLLQKLFTGDHKVLVFSQMVRVLDLLEELLRLERYRYERLDGSTSSSSRAHAVDRFNRKSCERFVMLLSTRAGGLGLNLTAADTVIIFDSDWNPQNDLQAMARAHRIGQTRAVRVYRLLTAKTYEMHMFHSASLKLGLERAVLSQNREQSAGETAVGTGKKSEREAQAKEIDELLKKGAYDVFRDEDDTEAEKFMESDIDQLLAHSSKQVTYGAASTNALGSGLGSFSKASFVAETEDGAKDVDLDDPDFWAKAVGLDKPEEVSAEAAHMLDAGVKRNRKQVQVYDPYAAHADAEQRKKQRIALEKKLEKEERERLKQEKKLQKQDKNSSGLGKISITLHKGSGSQSKPKEPKTQRITKTKKGTKLRAQKRAENADPMLERFRQAWEVPHRHRMVASSLRFGFPRFCKIRADTNFIGLPIHDLEIFFRAYAFQLGLQLGVSQLQLLSRKPEIKSRELFKEWLGYVSPVELSWLCETVKCAMSLHAEVQARRRDLRMPIVLAEPSFMEELRNGAAFRSLRRLCLLSRLNKIMDKCLTNILESLGSESLTKRGCIALGIDSLDPDMKARFVTTEELIRELGNILPHTSMYQPSVWWDRSCDLGLLVGTFLHGMGSYESMRNDVDLPFAEKLKVITGSEEGCLDACVNFRSASRGARQAFDNALEAARVKAELEVQAAVAAAAKAASKREEDAAVLRKGGAEAAAVMNEMPDTQVEDAFAFDGTDSHFVTLPRLQAKVHQLVRTGSEPKVLLGNVLAIKSAGESMKIKGHHLLPMPDARILDHRLLRLVSEAEGETKSEDMTRSSLVLWPKSSGSVDSCLKAAELSDRFMPNESQEYRGAGIGGNQCAATHRTLNDNSEYGYGSATGDLAHVAYGTDAPRYLRAIAVPMNVTRFALVALAHADKNCVRRLISYENLRYYGKSEVEGNLRLSRSDEEKAMAEKKQGKDPTELIPEPFRKSPSLRAYICIIAAFLGFPGTPASQIEFSASFSERLGVHGEFTLFDMNAFCSQVKENLTEREQSEMPPADAVEKYIVDFLLPHCLRLCLYGNGEMMQNARGSHGDYNTALGVSASPDPGAGQPVALPDPCVDLKDHSMEALSYASAILRRVQLLQSIRSLCCGRFGDVSAPLKSKMLVGMHGTPKWWRQSHDLWLLFEATRHGLFSMIPNRSSIEAFRPESSVSLVEDSFAPTSRGWLRHFAMGKAEQWVHGQASYFPSLRWIERRLSFICTAATRNIENEDRYNNLPMFDHGGWPRN